MVTAGIDVGAKTTKVVLVDDGRVIGKSVTLTGFDQLEAVNESLAQALRGAGIDRNKIDAIVSTGVGRKAIPFANDTVTEMIAMARGAVKLFLSARTVIDVGAEEGRCVKCNAEGKVVDMAANEKCAAGAGAFVETMARALELPLEKMGPLSLESQEDVPMNAQCTIFAESEVVSLIHARTPKADIVRAVHKAIASRISSMVRRVGIEKDVVVVGGVAKNIGFLRCLKDDLKVELVTPEEPEYIGALGAALIAASGL